MTAQRFKGLDGLRGVCALTIVIHHCKNVFNHGTLLGHGYLAVDIFFILSGFVIALTYEQRLKSDFTFLSFMRARAFRLLPTFWVGVALNALVFTVYRLPDADGDVLPALALLLTLVGTGLMIPQISSPYRYMFPTLTVAWSLLVEEIVNIAYGSFLFRMRTRWLLLVIALSWGPLVICNLPWFLGYRPCDLWFAVLRGFGGFLTGVVISRHYRHRVFERLPVVSPALLFAVWIAISALPLGTPPVLDSLLVIGVAPLLISLLVRSESRAPAYYKFLGAISYPLYVTHWTVLALGVQSPVFRHPNPLAGLYLVAICIFVAWLLYRLMDLKPMERIAQAVIPSRK